MRAETGYLGQDEGAGGGEDFRWAVSGGRALGDAQGDPEEAREEEEREAERGEDLAKAAHPGFADLLQVGVHLFELARHLPDRGKGDGAQRGAIPEAAEAGGEEHQDHAEPEGGEAREGDEGQEREKDPGLGVGVSLRG